jgi:arylsulfatase A-like enzyme
MGTLCSFQWHLGFFQKEYTPTYRGFDSYYGFWNGKEDYWDHSSQEDVWGTDLRDNERVGKCSIMMNNGKLNTDRIMKKRV